jgi:hypothetical protein
VKHEQPALPSYFFHGGFVDLRDVIGGAFSRCGGVISKSGTGMKNAGSSLSSDYSINGFWASTFWSLPIFLFKFGFYFMQFIASLIVTPLICFSITVFQIAILLALFLIVFFWFLFITFLDRTYCGFKAIASHCPNCQSKFSMPIYLCRECEVHHDMLRPGYYGILSRKCQCGEKLPTTFLNGRQKLKAICPACKGHEVKGGGLHASWSIPVIGGANSGKTCYINMTMMSLEKNSLSKYGLDFEYVKTERGIYEQNAQNLLHGNLPDKTEDRRLNYYQFYLTPKGATKQQVSLCDVAGELFDITDINGGNDKINTQIGFRYGNAFMLIIDPLSIPDYHKEVSKTTNLSDYKGSAQPIDEMLDTFVRTIQNMFGATHKDMLNTDVAVVFSKADIPGLAQKIGESAVLKNAPSLEPKVKYKTQNDICERFLRDYGEDNFLHKLKSSFKSVQFFTCSALGHIRNGQPFIASNVEEPFFWLLRKQSAVIDKSIKQITIQGGKK